MDNVILYLVLGFPVIFAVCAKLYKWDLINWTEMATQILLCCIVVFTFWNTFRYVDTWDTELWNGTVAQTNAVQKQCDQSWDRTRDSFCTNQQSKQVRDYPDSCTTDTKTKRRTCTARYHTEYRSIYPWERRYFVVSEDLDRDWEISRTDQQGVNYPPKFTEIKLGDPVSVTNNYTNWIQGASDSIFHQDKEIEERYAASIPTYPIALYDQFKVDRLVTVGAIKVPDLAAWNYDLGKILGELGPKRQMNAVIVLVDATSISSEYARALRRAWGGFKKNDAVIFFGVDKDMTLRWTEVLSWSKNELFNVTLRQDFSQGIGKPLDRASIISHIHDVGMASYERRSMTEFEFLKDQIPVPSWLIWLTGILSVGGSLGLFLVFLRYDFDPIGALTTR